MRCLLVGVYFVFATALAAPTCLGDDAAIAREVAEKLRFQQEQEALQGFHITVKVEDGTVWMMGDVADADQRNLALDAARRVKGVRLVVNDLDVAAEAVTASRPDPTPPTVERRVEEEAAVDDPSVDQTFVRQAAAVAQMAPPARPAVPHRMVVAAPASAGIPRYAGPLAPAHPVQVAQLSAANCYDGTCNAGMADGGYYSGGVVYEGGSPYEGGYGGGGQQVNGGVIYEGGGNSLSSGQPQMPNYAWPSYASYPNYGAVTYPQQYSPAAWPYIGPFYPYPQVPLGWRKVALEWDDGWWMLDFNSK